MAQLTDHTRAEDLFSAYIDQRVTPNERVFVEQHVAACASCRAQLQATRAMVTALKAMPAVKASRSFVLPKSMAKQPRPSIFNWYPALRLATVMAAVAFVLVFAGDLLTVRSNSGGNFIMSAAAPTVPAPALQQQAPAAAPPAQKLAPAAAQPTAESAPLGVAPAAGITAPEPTATSVAADTTRLAPFSAQAVPTETNTVTSTSETTATVAMAPTEEPTSEPAAAPATEAPMPAVGTIAPTPVIDPLRIVSIVLGGLVVVLGVVTLIVRRGA